MRAAIGGCLLAVLALALEVTFDGTWFSIVLWTMAALLFIALLFWPRAPEGASPGRTGISTSGRGRTKTKGNVTIEGMDVGVETRDKGRTELGGDTRIS